jgi:hypothetical protein
VTSRLDTENMHVTNVRFRLVCQNTTLNLTAKIKFKEMAVLARTMRYAVCLVKECVDIYLYPSNLNICEVLTQSCDLVTIVLRFRYISHSKLK